MRTQNNNTQRVHQTNVFHTKCVCCGFVGKLADSHVISKFVRLKLTGIETLKGKKFEFNYFQRTDLPKQDLPKPKLLCEPCDNKFGEDIEKLASKVLIPQGNVSVWSTWDQLPLYTKEILKIDGKEFNAATYQIESAVEECALVKFTVLTAWRALHAMSCDENKVAINFLASIKGRQLQHETVDFLRNGTYLNHLFFPYYSQIYFLGPDSAVAVTGANDESPFGWTFLEAGEQKGIAVILGYWVIIWSLQSDNDAPTGFKALIDKTFKVWLFDFASAMRQNRLTR